MTATQAQLSTWMADYSPVFFVLVWLLVTPFLGLFSGWFQLQRQFPRRDDRPVLSLRMRSGSMGMVSFGGVLSLGACPSGLRVGILRVFGPFQQPFQVPWNQIEAEPVTRFFEPMVRLHFGRPATGKLTVDLRSWQRLKSAATGMPAPISAATRRRLARGLLLQWAAITCIAGIFFFQGSRLAADMSIPIAVCFGLPAVTFGIALGIRFLFHAR